jgi:hypothetical protein
MWSSPGLYWQPEEVTGVDPNMLLWFLFSFLLGLLGRWGETFHRLNVSETATHVTRHYVSQQCQMRMRIVPLCSHALEIYYQSTYTSDLNKRTDNFWRFWQNSFCLRSLCLLNHEIWCQQAAALPLFFHFLIFSSKFNRTTRWEGTRTFVRTLGSAAPCNRKRGQ